jgi:hypothetical protein
VDRKCYRFSRDHDSSIYLCDFGTMIRKPRLAMVVTVSDKMKKYIKRQVKQAELAKEYQRKLGYASPGQLIKIIAQGQLTQSSGITAQDMIFLFSVFYLRKQKRKSQKSQENKT